MGYTTEYYGTFKTNKPISDKLKNYINKFSETRRMKRDPEIIKKIDPGWAERSYNGILGTEGEYYIAPDETPVEFVKFNEHLTGKTVHNDFGQNRDISVIDYNKPPSTQPGLWCQWIAADDGIEWDGGEKFYHAREWLEYLIRNFFEPEGYVLNGEVEWRGEDYDDLGLLIVQDNAVSEKFGRIVYE